MCQSQKIFRVMWPSLYSPPVFPLVNSTPGVIETSQSFSFVLAMLQDFGSGTQSLAAPLFDGSFMCCHSLFLMQAAMPSPCGGGNSQSFLVVALPSLSSVYWICCDAGCFKLDVRVFRCRDISVPVGFSNGIVDWSVPAGFWIGERVSVRVCPFSIFCSWVLEVTN